MKICLNTITTKPYPLEEDIRLISEYGYQGIEIDTDKLSKFLAAHTLQHLKQLLAAHKIEVAAQMAFKFAPFGDYSLALAKLVEHARLGQELGSLLLMICVGSSPPEGTKPEDIFRKAGQVAREYGDVVAPYGQNIAFELLAGEPLTPDLDSILGIVQEADHPNVGMMMDTFHFYKTGITPEEVVRIPKEKIFIVHINDCEDLPREKLTDGHRLYPGKGIIPLVRYLTALKEIGYDGHLSIEIFREEYWQDTHENIIKNAKASLEEVLSRL